VRVVKPSVKLLDRRIDTAGAMRYARLVAEPLTSTWSTMSEVRNHSAGYTNSCVYPIT